MSNCVLFSMPGNEVLTNSLSKLLNAETGEAIIRHRPDGETYIKVLSNMYEKEAIIVCSLHHPDDKILPLYFVAKTLKELRAYPVTLVVPYLAYMQQDKNFISGDSMNSDFFGQLLSFFVDKLITVDLHRNNSLNEIYSIHTSVLNISSHISKWVNENIHKPLMVGMCKEKEQLLSSLAEEAKAPFIILEKKGKAEKRVNMSAVQVENYKGYTPVIIENAISTGSNMIEAVANLIKVGMKAPVCIGVHIIPGGKASEKLIKAGAVRVVSSNTITHPSNAIFIDELLAQEICKNSFVVN